MGAEYALIYPHLTHHGVAILATLQGDRGPVDLTVHGPLVGAEIGVWRGKNSATLLARIPRLKLYMVDLWGSDPPEGADREQSLQTGEDICAEALAETSFAEDRRVVVKCASPAAAELIPEPLDFVFIDGDHRYEPCLADLRAWWPKVKPGGWLMGHDYANPLPFAEGWGVDLAVAEFCAERDLRVKSYPYPAMVFAIRKPEA